MATSVEEPESVDTQAGENPATAYGNEVCVETEESEFEKQEKQRQLRRKNPKKAKRKRVFVVTPQTQTANEKVTTVVNEKGEELLQITRDIDIEKADELFVNEVAAEMSDLADDEFQMKPRRYGVNICSYIFYWFRNSSFHKKLVKDYKEWYRDWVKYGDMAEIMRSVRMREKRLSSEHSEFRRSRRGERGTATRSYHEYSSASEEDDKQGNADNDTDDISKVQLHVDDDEK
uniref:Protein kinase domain-containing protein n=1 Tax=Parascaris univalens TaxID=6257 RepID=A0A915A149_PARUN